MKVQGRKIYNYKQLYVTLPYKICEAMNITKGTELNVSVSGKNRLEPGIKEDIGEKK